MGPYRRSLRVIQIESPCTRPWDEMEGFGPMRFCNACDQNVYDLSQLTAPEADELIELFEGSVCVRLVQRADGTLVSADCTEPSALKKRRRVIRMMAMGAASVALVASTFGAAYLLEPEPMRIVRSPTSRTLARWERGPDDLVRESVDVMGAIEGPPSSRQTIMGRHAISPDEPEHPPTPDPWESLGRFR